MDHLQRIINPFLDHEATRRSAYTILLKYHVLLKLIDARGLSLQTGRTEAEDGDSRDSLLPRSEADDEAVYDRHDEKDVRITRQLLQSITDSHKHYNDEDLLLFFRFTREQGLNTLERLQDGCHELVLKVTSLRNESLKRASLYTLGLTGTCLAISALDLLAAVPDFPGRGILLLVCVVPTIEGILLYPFLKKRWELSKSRDFSERVNRIVQAMVNKEKVTLAEIMAIGQRGTLPGVDFDYLDQDDSTQE